MRISDWSSEGCYSDLHDVCKRPGRSIVEIGRVLPQAAQRRGAIHPGGRTRHIERVRGSGGCWRMPSLVGIGEVRATVAGRTAIRLGQDFPPLRLGMVEAPEIGRAHV